MERFNISLALFTWLTQASVGLVIFRSFYLRMPGSGKIKHVTGQVLLFISLLMLVIGLLFSFMHLNYPRNAFNALNNLGSSCDKIRNGCSSCKGSGHYMSRLPRKRNEVNDRIQKGGECVEIEIIRGSFQDGRDAWRFRYPVIFVRGWIRILHH